jgi:PII-like signaling protein
LYLANLRQVTNLRLSADLPLVIEIVDSEEYINRLLPFLDETIGEGLITMEKVRIIRYKGHE